MLLSLTTLRTTAVAEHSRGVRKASVLFRVFLVLVIALVALHCAGTPRYTRLSTSPVPILVKNLPQPAIIAHPTPIQAKKQVQLPTSQIEVTPPLSTEPAAPETPNFFQTGKASYYANKFHGRKTASGERYNKTAFTAAHRTLPFGTIARITNLATQQSVVVRINDRGPVSKQRVIDVSAAAAEALAMKRAGIAMVGIEIVSGD